jgi:hypothetical protein
MTNKVNIELSFEFGEVNGVMSVDLNINRENIKVTPENKTVQVLTTLPTAVIISINGKKPNDTIVDENGNIIADKYVKLTDIKFDYFPVNEIFLHQKIKFNTENHGIITTSYFGFNGEVILNFNASTVLEQILLCNSATIYEDSASTLIKNSAANV